MMRKNLLLAASLCALAATARAEAPFDFDKTPGELPKTVAPSSYEIDLVPDLTNLTLAGREVIDITVRTATADIVLNQKGLKLWHAALDDGDVASVAEDDKAQTATLHFPAALVPGHHKLTINYTGAIPENPNGIYYDDYKTAAGAKKRMLVTQFEVADARTMFPGWDEPAFKATFQLSVTVPKGLEAISNMPGIAATPVGDSEKRVEFATTPRMSSYLLALVVGDMAAVTGEADGTKMRAWAPEGEEPKAAYALSAEEKILPYYDDYFGVKFPLPKLDLIAIPGNYEAGAMENWGAITFIDDAMQLDPKTSSPRTRETIFYVVAHEMAHQWSGDLVTMGWWNDIWLNEGFASWMGQKASDHFNPAWQIWPREHQSREQAMGQDALPTTHPIQVPIASVSEANSAFDSISYQKGEQIIRMVEDWVGPDVFRDGMRRYMAAHKYGNSTSADLWASLSAASGKDVGKVAATFTEQPGIPLVHVARSCEGTKASLTLTQDRFTIHDPKPKALTWTIPVTLGAPGMTPVHVLLGSEPVTVPIADCNAAVKANYGENGYYRVQYDAASLDALTPVLSQLSAADRANLTGDQFALFMAGRAPLDTYLRLLSALKDETNIAVWTDTLGHLHRLYDALAGSPLRDKFDAYAVSLIRPEFERLGWDAKPGESFLDTLLRPDLVASLGRYGDAAVVAEAGKRFQAFLKDADSLPAALRSPVLDIVGHSADQATYDQLKALGVKATSTEEKLRYFQAMASAADPKLMQQTVDFLDSGEIPNGRIVYVAYMASAASGSPDLLFHMALPKEASLAKRIPQDGISPTLPIAAAAGSSSPDTAREMLAQKSSNASPGAHVWALRVADMIGESADLRARAQEALAAFLKDHS